MGRILVADDEEVIVNLLKNALEGAGHDVVGTSDGLQALKMALSAEFSLYVFDVRMPRLDGYSLCNSIRKKFPGRPVVLVTGLPPEKYEAMARASGATLIISKPFDEAEFMRQVEKYLPKSV
jgi:CheY-like chemotaxis protein